MEAVGLKEFLLEQRDKEDFGLYLYFLSLCYSWAFRKALLKHSSLVSSYSTDEEGKAHVSTLGPESEIGEKHCLHLRRLAQYWQLLLGRDGDGDGEFWGQVWWLYDTTSLSPLKCEDFLFPGIFEASTYSSILFKKILNIFWSLYYICVYFTCLQFGNHNKGYFCAVIFLRILEFYKS